MKNKGLWLLGLFATILGGIGEYEILMGAFYGQVSQEGIISSTIASFNQGMSRGLEISGGNIWLSFWQSLTANPVSVIVPIIIMIISLVITIFLIWLGIISQGGLVQGISQTNKNRKLSLNEGLDFGAKNGWSILWINVITKAVIFIFLFFIGREILWINASGFSVVKLVLYYFSFVIFMMAVLIASFLFRNQLLFIILKKMKFVPALKAAWELFIRNWLISIEMAISLFIAYIIAATLNVFIVAVLTAVPAVVLPAYFPFLPFIISVIIAAVSLILMFVFVFTITGLLLAFQWSCWVLLFAKLVDGEEIPKIVRSVEQLKNFSGSFLKKN